MVVGEPSLMGGEFGEEDERLISRLEMHSTTRQLRPLKQQQLIVQIQWGNQGLQVEA